MFECEDSNQGETQNIITKQNQNVDHQKKKHVGDEKKPQKPSHETE